MFVFLMILFIAHIFPQLMPVKLGFPFVIVRFQFFTG